MRYMIWLHASVLQLTLPVQVTEQVIWFAVLGTVAFFSSWVGMAAWMYSAERQTKRIREAFLQAVLQQPVGNANAALLRFSELTAAFVRVV